MEYTYFELNNNSIEYQTEINGLLITPYTNGIAVNFNNIICLNCKAIEGEKVEFDNKIIKFTNNIFYIGWK